jgi:hypothetical protein
MVGSRKKLLACCAASGILLLSANVLVALRHLGTRAGQTYHWVCRESGAELSCNPSVFGSARLVPPDATQQRGWRWELVEPRPLSSGLPWNWLALLLESPVPDAEAVIREANLNTE